METQKHHYSGLTDAEVLASRKQNGVNVLTPPEKETFWDKVIECFKNPLIKVLILLLVLSVIGFGIWGNALPSGIWIKAGHTMYA